MIFCIKILSATTRNDSTDETAETLESGFRRNRGDAYAASLCSHLALMGFHRSGANTIRHQLPLAPAARSARRPALLPPPRRLRGSEVTKSLTPAPEAKGKSPGWRVIPGRF